jgi:uracil-DNA glycosylase
MEKLVDARIGGTFNFYRDGEGAAARAGRLERYLHERRDARILLVGEAPGYRGTRVSGIPLTSERQLTGAGPGEATATIVHAVLGELGIADDVLLWNVVPTHPGTASSNRHPTRGEIEAGRAFLDALVPGRRVIGLGRIAQSACGGPYVRHPSHGGAAAFRSGVAALING